MATLLATAIAFLCAVSAMGWESEERQKQVKLLNNLARTCQVECVKVNAGRAEVRGLLDAIRGSGASSDVKQQAARYHAAFEGTFNEHWRAVLGGRDRNLPFSYIGLPGEDLQF